MLIGKKILLVEDDQFIRELFEAFLQTDGYTIITAENGNEAVEKFKLEIFDLVLLDILLPEKDGISVLGDIKKINPVVPVAMLTNLSQESLIKKSFELGAISYLLKARITKEDLLKEVATMLSNSVHRVNPNIQVVMMPAIASVI